MIPRIAMFFVLALGAAAPVIADWNPTRPLKLVVPYAPGGQPDLIARALAEPLSKALGQPVVVDNRPGAGGNIGTEAVAHAAPDGYTLLLGTNGPLVVNPALTKTRYDPLTELAAVTLIGTSPSLIAVRSDSNIRSIADLVSVAKSRPAGLNYGSVGVGSVSQLSMELLNRREGLHMVHIPYNGGAPAVAALIAGDIDVLSINPTPLIAHVESGRLRLLAQTSETRSAFIQDVPTLAELGYRRYDVRVWMAVMAPAGTPAPAIERLHTELARIIRDPAMKARLWDRQWIDPVAATPQAASALIRRELSSWARSGIVLEAE
jgi:tripartite-type tricarboxylate transporter receptor subunit TctC